MQAINTDPGRGAGAPMPVHVFEPVGSRSRQEIADEALQGFEEARCGAPFDKTQSEAWQGGWHCWHEARR
jgi:hypothetical protein